MAKTSFFDEFFEDDTEGMIPEDVEAYKEILKRKDKVNRIARKRDVKHEVGVVAPISPEMEALKRKCADDFLFMHEHLFPESTGEKPFGPQQQESTLWSQKIFKGGGRIIKLEPRGFAKTTRFTNETTFSTLMGFQQFTVIVASSMEKAQDILSAIKTELANNDQLMDLFPSVCACFRKFDVYSSSNAVRQTYDGNPTNIRFTTDTIHFPDVPGEPSAGAVIKVRPLSNLKGINWKVKSGPNKGKVFRPTLYIFDDPQTEDEAISPSSVKKIIDNIKRSALKGGSHRRPVSAIMAITPVKYGDVAWWFTHMEDSWDLVSYKMITKWPENEELWKTEYAEIRSKFDRTIRGSRDKAYKEAAQFVIDNYDKLHDGAKWAWDEAYAPGEPLYEVSPLQHAYNVILDDGIEDFEFEYQCNTEYGTTTDSVTINCPEDRIIKKQLPLPRGIVQQEAQYVVTHIDVNMDILSWVTMASGNPMRPHIIDYGTYPDQRGLWSKSRRLSSTLRNLYSKHNDYRDVLYHAVRDLVEFLAGKEYSREDGIKFKNSLIGVDVRFEENYIARSIRDSPFRNIIVPCWGIGVGPDDELLHHRRWPEGSRIFQNVVEQVVRDRSAFYLQHDTNFWKTELHRGLNLDVGIRGSVTLFEEQFEDQHALFALHCNSEMPKTKPGKKSINHRIMWYEKKSRPDNEWFDNSTACLALLTKLGLQSEHDVHGPDIRRSKNDMASWIAKQKNKKLV